MKIERVNRSAIKINGWAFIGDSWRIVQINNSYAATNSYLEKDVELSDYFEDWENPTETEMSLFELERGYRLEFCA